MAVLVLIRIRQHTKQRLARLRQPPGWLSPWKATRVFRGSNSQSTGATKYMRQQSTQRGEKRCRAAGLTVSCAQDARSRRAFGAVPEGKGETSPGLGQLHAQALPTSCTRSAIFMYNLCQLHAYALPTSCTISANFMHTLCQLHVQYLLTLPQILPIS